MPPRPITFTTLKLPMVCPSIGSSSAWATDPGGAITAWPAPVSGGGSAEGAGVAAFDTGGSGSNDDFDIGNGSSASSATRVPDAGRTIVEHGTSAPWSFPQIGQ